MNKTGHGSKQTATSQTNSVLVIKNQRKGEKYYKTHTHTHIVFT